MKKNLAPELLVVVVILAAALTRLIPHWPNFTPIMAMALVGGAVLRHRAAGILVPLAAMLVSDLALGLVLGNGYAWHNTQWAVYGSILAISLMGMGFRKSSAVRTTLIGGTAAGLGFFVVTNFAVWLGGTMYPLTLEGLMACYAAGLAFYRDSGSFLLNGLVSTWLFAGAMFAVLHVATKNRTVEA
jgi:hypothetical protein